MSLDSSTIKSTKWTSLRFFIVECCEQKSLLLRTIPIQLQAVVYKSFPRSVLRWISTWTLC